MDVLKSTVNGEILSSVILDLMPVAVVIVDKERKIVYANRHSESIFNYDRSYLIGKPLEILVPNRFRRKHNKGINDFMENPHNATMGNLLNAYGLKSNKQEFPVEIGLTPLSDDNGQVLFIASIIDMTKMKNISNKLEETLFENHDLNLRIQSMKQKLSAINEQIA